MAQVVMPCVTKQPGTGFLPQKTGFCEISEKEVEVSNSQNWKERSRSCESCLAFCFLTACVSF